MRAHAKREALKINAIEAEEALTRENLLMKEEKWG